MDKTTLVEKDYKDGELLIQALDQSGVEVHSAFWLYDAEMDQWNLMLAVPRKAEPSTRTLLYKIRSVLDEIKPSLGITLQDISPTTTENPLIQDLGKAINTGKSIKGIRLSRNMIGRSYIEDAYIYRVQ